MYLNNFNLVCLEEIDTNHLEPKDEFKGFKRYEISTTSDHMDIKPYKIDILSNLEQA